jgi:predicted enzyme related to lactoylglutathione lyase
MMSEGRPMANPVGWFEVSGPDAGALQRFYREAL